MPPLLTPGSHEPGERSSGQRKIMQYRQWDQPEGAGLTRTQSMKKITKRIKGTG
jgi:hypothetical protein